MLSREAIARPSHFTRAAVAPAVGRFRVYHVCLNRRVRGVVPSWRLFEFLRGLKVLNIYDKISGLRDGDWFEFSTVVHERPLNITVRTAVWGVISNPGLEASVPPGNLLGMEVRWR